MKKVLKAAGCIVLGMIVLRFALQLWAPMLLFGLFWMLSKKFGVSFLHLGIGVLCAVGVLAVAVKFGARTVVALGIIGLNFLIGRKLIRVVSEGISRIKNKYQI